MARDFGQGVFTMDIISHVATMSDIAAAKVYAHDAVQASNATSMNKIKAAGMINKAHNSKALLLGMSNFMLSHSGLKTIK